MINENRDLGFDRASLNYSNRNMDYLLDDKRIKSGNGIVIQDDVSFTLTENAVLEIGNDCKFGMRCELLLTKPNPHLIIGDNTSIERNTIIACKNKVTIGKNCLIGPNCYITDTSHGHDRNKPIVYQLSILKETDIRDDVWLGVGAVVLAGVTIAKGSIIGANAVVTRSTEEYGIYAGNPARKIGERTNGFNSSKD